MDKASLSLDATEAVVLQAAAVIYAGYVQRGMSHSDVAKNQELRERAVQKAMALARLTDDAVQTESEFS